MTRIFSHRRFHDVNGTRMLADLKITGTRISADLKIKTGRGSPRI
jgi:hypothetical protein